MFETGYQREKCRYKFLLIFSLLKSRWKVKKNKVFQGVFHLFDLPIQILKLGVDNDLHVKKIYDLGFIKQIEKYYPGNYGAPGVKRNKKQKRTPEDIARQNYTNRWKKIQRLILANFKEGDWHLILKYGKGNRPGSYKDAEKHRNDFIAAVRKIYKKAGIPFKWIAVTERGKKRQVLHHHFVIEDFCTEDIVTVKLIKELWNHGSKFFVSLYEDGEYEKLAEYIVKAETKEEAEWSTYSRSRNMVVPIAEREVINRKRWKKDPVAPKGWYVVKDSVFNGINPVTEYPYQHYTIARIRGKENEAKCRKKRGKYPYTSLSP